MTKSLGLLFLFFLYFYFILIFSATSPSIIKKIGIGQNRWSELMTFQRSANRNRPKWAIGTPLIKYVKMKGNLICIDTVEKGTFYLQSLHKKKEEKRKKGKKSKKKNAEKSPNIELNIPMRPSEARERKFFGGIWGTGELVLRTDRTWFYLPWGQVPLRAKCQPLAL